MTAASTKPVWTHITIAVSDVDKSVAFYREWCGLRVARDRRLEGGSTVWLSTADDIATERDFVLVIGAGEAACPVNHFGFQFDSIDKLNATAEKATTAGILVTPPTFVGGSVGTYAMIKDPDGHLVEFTHGQPIRGLD